MGLCLRMLGHDLIVPNVYNPSNLRFSLSRLEVLSDEELMDKIKDIMSLLDKKGDGCIDSKQVIDALRISGLNPLTEDVEGVGIVKLANNLLSFVKRGDANVAFSDIILTFATEGIRKNIRNANGFCTA